MKKLFCLVVLCGLAACAQQPSREDMQACLTDKAADMVKNGDVSAAPMRSSVKKLLKACGVEVQTPELKQMAQSALTIAME